MMVRLLLTAGLMAGMAVFGSIAPVAAENARSNNFPVLTIQNDHTADLAVQFQRLLTAERREVAILAEQEIWRLWFIGATTEQTERLAEASMVMQQGGLGEAVVLLSELTTQFPKFAEARNQLAFARFLLGDLQSSLKDIEAVLVLEPRHFGALAGRARIEASLGQLDKAQRTMGEVGVVHPWMARLSPIRPNPPPPPPPEVRDL